MTDRRRTLLVDDADESRPMIRSVLERSGRYEVVGEAGDGHEAIAAATVHNARLDLVLLDLSMPRMDGLEALPHLRRIAPDARLVVFSGFAEARAAEAARRAGAHRYLEKGLAPDALLAALDAVAPSDDAVPAAPSRTVVRPSAMAQRTSEVVGRLAHDVRTPLLTARGAVSLVREELGALDPDLADLVTNLVDNAIRYSDGPVELIVAADDREVTVEVRDHGPGFGDGGQDLFAPFARGSAGRTVAGSGSGLATAADLTRRLGGDLSATDLADGASVTLRLPAAR